MESRGTQDSNCSSLTSGFMTKYLYLTHQVNSINILKLKEKKSFYIVEMKQKINVKHDDGIFTRKTVINLK